MAHMPAIDNPDQISIAGLQTRIGNAEDAIDAIETDGVGARLFNVTSYGDDLSTPAALRAAIVAAAAAAEADGGGSVLLPGGTYTLERDGANSWMLDWPYDNVNLVGEPGRTILQVAAGMAAASISMIRIDDKESVTIRDIIFDGNWGAVSGVTTTLDGINHSTQVDPKSHAVMVRGSEKVLIENCVFRQVYGDGVWIGTSADGDLDNWSRDVRIVGCDFDLCARNGITFGAASERLHVERCTFTDIYTTCIDAEPVGMFGGVREVRILNCPLMEGWWDGTHNNLLISAVGGEPSGFNHSAACRDWRIEGNHIHGSIYVSSAIDVVIRANHIWTDFVTQSAAFAPIVVDHVVDGITIEGNWIYDNMIKSATTADYHNGAIQVTNYGSGNVNLQPAGVRIRGNYIFARQGVHGIWVAGVGGFVYGGEGVNVTASSTGTATGVTQSTLTNSGAAWTVNQWIGWRVIMGGATAIVQSNTATVLTLIPSYAVVRPQAWFSPLGEEVATPTAGTYAITSLSGVLDIDSNDIDCGADGNAKGGQGIYLFTSRAGGRIRIRNNNLKNCDLWGIFLNQNSLMPLKSLELTGNRGWDDQAVATMSALIRAANADSFTASGRFVMNDNGWIGGGSTVLSGVSAGKWLLADGDIEQWCGYGAPAFSAPQGSTYIRKDGTDATTFYVNTDGGTTWSAR